MCTVTLIPKGKTDFILTSSRDEAPDRETLPPDFYVEGQTTLLYPKDKLAGGTWLGASEKQRVICLLNGGFSKHQRAASYTMSRGVVVKALLVADHLEDAVKTFHFKGIEPFTIVVVDWSVGLRFFELVWDGETSYFKALPLAPRIWSSSTLYTPEMKLAREGWFADFKKSHALEARTLLEFHKTTHLDNKTYGVVMDRGVVRTTSITQVAKTDDVLQMVYNDLKKEEPITTTFPVTGNAYE